MCIFFCNFAPKLKYAYFMQTALLIILTVAVLIFGFWLIQYSGFRNEEKKRQFELRRESQKSISPIRLRAYERLALLLERTKPEHMLMDLRAKEPDAMTTWTIGQVQQYLLQTIRAEFDHNARDQMAAFIIAMSAQLPAGATAQVYCQTLITAYNSNGATPTDKALEELKDEAKTLM